jgi:hypothetical protein
MTPVSPGSRVPADAYPAFRETRRHDGWLTELFVSNPMVRRSWLGGGKWLARRLRTADPRAVRHPDGGPARGGRLMEGYHCDYPSRRPKDGT